ncbi:unnamed protein product [Amoebophrya sp. A120]|nr:unnamed protein product [Amoebophrya sp. A120]|eukprot:GSA120T00004595001.1
MGGKKPKDFWNPEIDDGRDYLQEARDQFAAAGGHLGQTTALDPDIWTVATIMTMMPHCYGNFRAFDLRAMNSWPWLEIDVYETNRLQTTQCLPAEDEPFFKHVLNFFHERIPSTTNSASTSLVVWEHPLILVPERLEPDGRGGWTPISANVSESGRVIHEERCRIGMATEYLFQAQNCVHEFGPTNFDDLPYGYCLDTGPREKLNLDEKPEHWPEKAIAEEQTRHSKGSTEPLVHPKWHETFRAEFYRRASFWRRGSTGSGAKWSYIHFRWNWIKARLKSHRDQNNNRLDWKFATDVGESFVYKADSFCPTDESVRAEFASLQQKIPFARLENASNPAAHETTTRDENQSAQPAPEGSEQEETTQTGATRQAQEHQGSLDLTKVPLSPPATSPRPAHSATPERRGGTGPGGPTDVGAGTAEPSGGNQVQPGAAQNAGSGAKAVFEGNSIPASGSAAASGGGSFSSSSSIFALPGTAIDSRSPALRPPPTRLAELKVASLDERQTETVSCENLFVEFLEEQLAKIPGMEGLKPKDFWNADVDHGRDYLQETNAFFQEYEGPSDVVESDSEDEEDEPETTQGGSLVLGGVDLREYLVPKHDSFPRDRWTVRTILAMMPFCHVDIGAKPLKDLVQRYDYSYWPSAEYIIYSPARLETGCALQDKDFFAEVWDFLHERVTHPPSATPGAPPESDSDLNRSVIVWDDPSTFASSSKDGTVRTAASSSASSAGYEAADAHGTMPLALREQRCRIAMTTEFLFQATGEVRFARAWRFSTFYGYCLNTTKKKDLQQKWHPAKRHQWPEEIESRQPDLSPDSSPVPMTWHTDFQREFRKRARFWRENSTGRGPVWSYRHFRWIWLKARRMKIRFRTNATELKFNHILAETPDVVDIYTHFDPKSVFDQFRPIYWLDKEKGQQSRPSIQPDIP